MLGHHINRVHVICCGAALWGLMCLGFATASSVGQGLAFWAINGIGWVGAMRLAALHLPAAFQS